MGVGENSTSASGYLIANPGALKVLAVTLSTEPAGTDHSLRNLAYAGDWDSVHITLAGPGGTGLEEWWRDSGFAYLPLDLTERSGFSNPANGARTPARELARSMAGTIRSARVIAGVAGRFDLIHSNWLFSHLDVTLAGRLTRTPVLLELHDILPAGIGRHLLSGAVACSNGGIAISNAVARQLGKSARAKTKVIHQGIDTARFSPGAVSREHRQALLGEAPGTEPVLAAIIGRFDPKKGLATAIEATAIARTTHGIDLRLALIGAPSEDGGGYEAQMRCLAAELIPSAHTFSGPSADVPTILRSVDILIVSSFDEPFGLIAAEAQACGIPVVVSDSGGLPEFVLDGATGYVFPTGDAAAAADAMARLASDANLRRQFGRAGRASIVSRYDIGMRATAMHAEYARVSGGRRRPA